MARTDNDTWEITESVGATALGVASARAGGVTVPGARRRDRPASAVAEDGRELREHPRVWRPARPHLCLHERDAGELGVDGHLARAGHRIRHLSWLKYLRRPEGPHHYRSHGGPPFSE